MAVMHPLPHAAGTGRSSHGRQRDRDQASQQREQQQEFGGQAMHCILLINNSK
jgi:hypothetical protein